MIFWMTDVQLTMCYIFCYIYYLRFAQCRKKGENQAMVKTLVVAMKGENDALTEELIFLQYCQWLRIYL
jgi:hypothetical protein